MNIKQKNIKLIAYLFISIILTLGLSISFQSLLAAWTTPTAAPPGDNISPPVTESLPGDNQAILGGLVIGETFAVSGESHLMGEVGIGTTNPGYELDINGNARVGSAGAGYLYFGNRGYYIGDDLSGSDIQTNAPNMYVYDSGWKRLVREGDSVLNGDNLGNHTASQNIKLSGYWLSNDGGDEGVYVKTDGKVGIGTTDPGVKLDVAGNVNLDTELRIDDISPQIRFEDTGESTYWIHANSNRLYFLWDENLGGSWVSPYPLYFDGRDSVFGGNLQIASSKKILFNGGSTYGVGASGSNYNSISVDTVDSGSSTDTLELVYYKGTNVKIGPGSGTHHLLLPNGHLKLWGGIYDTYGGGDSYYLDLDVGGNVKSLGIENNLTVGGQVIGGFGAQTTGGTLNWNDTSNIRSGSGYTLLLGNASNGPGPGTYFHPFNFEYSSKNGSGNMTQLAIPYGATGHMNSGIYMRGRYSGTWSPWMKILSENSSGNVSGISNNLTVGGKTISGSTGHNYSPVSGSWDYNFQLDGSDYTSIGFHDSGETVHSIRHDGYEFYIGYNDGWGTANLNVGGNVTAGAFYCSSDRSLKKNIQPISNALEKVLQLDGIIFEWKESGEKSIGLIAQGVEKAFPELVTTDGETGLKLLQYGNLVAPLIEAIKEQQQQIEDLREEIKQLKLNQE